MPVQLVLCLWAEAQTQPLVLKHVLESRCEFVIDLSCEGNVERYIHNFVYNIKFRTYFTSFHSYTICHTMCAFAN